MSTSSIEGEFEKLRVLVVMVVVVDLPDPFLGMRARINSADNRATAQG